MVNSLVIVVHQSLWTRGQEWGEVGVAAALQPSSCADMTDLLGKLGRVFTAIRAGGRRKLAPPASRLSAYTRLGEAMDQSADGFVLIDSDRRVVICSREIEDFCGGPSLAPQVGESLDEAAARVVKGGVFALRTEQQKSEPLIQLRSAGRLDIDAMLSDGRWVRLVRSETESGGALFSVSDITTRKEREAQLCEAAAGAAAANGAKSEFLATMGHEMRTPLNAVIGFSELIAREQLGPLNEPQYREFAAEILNNGRSLLTIINDILMLVKSESGDLTLDPDVIDMGELLEECVHAIQATFDEAGVKLEMGPVVRPCLAVGDRTRLRKAVLNLMSNAAKFTPPGGAARVAALCAADRQVCITVADTGIGMHEAEIPLALAPFGRIDSGTARRFEGTGLGLTLARAIVDLHLGEMRIESAPGAGTTVAIFLPAAEAATEGLVRQAS